MQELLVRHKYKKFVDSNKMKRLNLKELDLIPLERMNEEQMKYKYILDIEGNSSVD